MPALEDAGPLIGTVASDTGTYKPTGNKFTGSHRPGTEDDESDDPPAKELPLSLHQTKRNKTMKTIH